MGYSSAHRSLTGLCSRETTLWDMANRSSMRVPVTGVSVGSIENPKNHASSASLIWLERHGCGKSQIVRETGGKGRFAYNGCRAFGQCTEAALQ